MFSAISEAVAYMRVFLCVGNMGRIVPEFDEAYCKRIPLVDGECTLLVLSYKGKALFSGYYNYTHEMGH